MNEKHFSNLLLLIAITGTVLLLIYHYFSIPTEISLFEDNSTLLEKKVSVSGTIKNITPNNNHVFFKICQYSKCIDAVYFNISKTNLVFLEKSYLENNKIEVVGKLTFYNNKLEIISNSLIRGK